jgi:RHS repeat-associated protein
MLIGLAVLAGGGPSLVAQVPVLGSVEAPYANVQGSVRVAGQSYGSGAVAYGSVGTPLVLLGSALGDTGTVKFIAYKNGAVDPNVSPVTATPTFWSSTMILVPVPSGAYTGMIQVYVEDKTSNQLPIIVTPGEYAGTCPAGPPQSQLQIVTASLSDGTVSQSYSATVSASGGTPPYTWSIAGGSLPAGLSLAASTGIISGTPTASVSQASLTFEVKDSSTSQKIDQAVLDLSIEPAQLTSANVYSYSATYDGLGNVSQYQDTVMGTWNFTYDDLNRLESGSAISGGSGSQDFTGQNICWAYDSYGNRTAQSAQTAACPSQESSLTPTESYNSSNQFTSELYEYDASGDLTSDATVGNSYVYDAEGRICAVQSTPVLGFTTMTGYIYDAEGNRVAKGTITTLSCDPTQNGFQFAENYVLGPSGEELSMLNGSNTWQRTNVYAGGKLIGTYDTLGLHFHLEDPLGTRRMQLSAIGQPETDIQSWPFGDQLFSFPDQYAPVTADDATTLHFTSKERDTESGNDYFGARYYASSMGRFMSPDPTGGHVEDPQSLNKYSYVENDPLIRTDPTGLDFNLQCSGGNTATCQGGVQGTTSTDANGKSKFTATVISNDKNGGLVDQNGNKYNATVSGAGVSFSQVGSKKSSMGTFVNGTNATKIQGSGTLSGFTFNFTSSDMASNVSARGTFTYNGSFDEATAALKQAGFQHYIGDEADFFHSSGENYDAYDLRAPGGPGGAGGGHFVVHDPVQLSHYGPYTTRNHLSTVPSQGDADLGTHNPWVKGGMGAHLIEVWNWLTGK